ncbi:MAG: TVP38/TMEM64 family protein [Alphaproteobacteria bacterium]
MAISFDARRRLIIAGAVILVLAVIYGALSWSGALTHLLDGEGLRMYVEGLGWLGPVAVVALMGLAIVLSPIPSAPIAMAAGAAYGDLWGAIYVGIGAEAGAVLAFCIARFLGRDVMLKWFGERVTVGWIGSQNALMAIVFATRLMPFLSFDLISYAAGLTPLAFWRFAVATLLGIAPASFLLAHFGNEFASADARRVGMVVLGLGMITLVPVVVKIWLDWRRGRRKCAAKPPA